MSGVLNKPGSLFFLGRVMHLTSVILRYFVFIELKKKKNEGKMFVHYNGLKKQTLTMKINV